MEDVAVSPEPFIQKCRSLPKLNLIRRLWIGASAWLWMVSSEDGTACKIKSLDRVEAIVLGISYEMLLDALFEAGGAISCGRKLTTKNLGAWYPGKGFLCLKCAQSADVKPHVH